MMAAVIPKTMVTAVPESSPPVVVATVWFPDEREKGVDVAGKLVSLRAHDLGHNYYLCSRLGDAYCR
jgi:hypothetical protein